MSAGGLRLRVRLTPKSSRDAVEGLETVPEGPAIKARVRAVPGDGKANTAVAVLIADWLGLPKGQVTVVAGYKSRIKTLHIEGAADEMARRVEALIDTAAIGSNSRCGKRGA